jgi:hypothetical protein
MDYQPSTINHQPSTIDHRPSTIYTLTNEPSTTTINHQPSTIIYSLLFLDDKVLNVERTMTGMKIGCQKQAWGGV